MDNGIYSQKLRAGKRRTYFFDVRTTKSNDYYITITESKKRFDDEGYDRHKLFLYKEDFNKFITALSDAVDHVKNDLMPDYDFEEFDREAEEIIPKGTALPQQENQDDSFVEADSNFSESTQDINDISLDDDLTF